MLSLRVSRDKRGYDHIYLLYETRRKGRPVTRLVYGGRWPSPMRVGQQPLDEATRRTLEQAHPDITFDWVTLQRTMQQALSVPRATPIPERRRRPGAPGAAGAPDPSRSRAAARGGAAPGPGQGRPGQSGHSQGGPSQGGPSQGGHRGPAFQPPDWRQTPRLSELPPDVQEIFEPGADGIDLPPDALEQPAAFDQALVAGQEIEIEVEVEQTFVVCGDGEAVPAGSSGGERESIPSLPESTESAADADPWSAVMSSLQEQSPAPTPGASESIAPGVSGPRPEGFDPNRPRRRRRRRRGGRRTHGEQPLTGRESEAEGAAAAGASDEGASDHQDAHDDEHFDGHDEGPDGDESGSGRPPDSSV